MCNNILSIDVEEIFHIEYYEKIKNDVQIYRSIENVPLILDLLDECNSKATFFVLGEIIEKYPSLLKIIENRGHELAYHGWSHTSLLKTTQNIFKLELKNFLKLHPSCIGFRAPSFSLNENSKWVLDILKNENIKYDSSIFPAITILYGTPRAPIYPYKISLNNLEKPCDNGIWEFPLLVYPILGLRIPTAGGFYFRMMPKIVDYSIKLRNKKGFPAVIYIHNWELDPNTPILKINSYRSFITYYNIKKTFKIFKKLLKNYEFTSFKNYLMNINADL